MKSTTSTRTDALLSSVEVAADIVMYGDVAASVPVIGTAFKLCQALDSVRDRLFAKKIVAFLTGLGNVSDQKHQDMFALLESRAGAIKVGAVLTMTIEQVTELEKAELLGALFRRYVDEAVSGDELRRLVAAINTAFWDDLVAFVWNERTAEVDQRLLAAGLTAYGASVSMGALSVPTIVVTPVGKQLISLCSGLPRPL